MRSLLESLRVALIGPRWASADEKLFYRRWIEDYHRSLAYICAVLALFFHLVAPWIEDRYGLPAAYAAVRPFHVAYVLTFVLWLAFGRRVLKAQPFVQASILVFIGAYALPLGLSIDAYGLEPGDANVRGVAVEYFVLALFGVLMAPYHSLVVPGTALAFWVLGFLACKGSLSEMSGWVTYFGVGLFMMVVVKLYLLGRARHEAVRDYRTRLKIAPSPVVRMSAGSGRALDEVFAPAVRRCVCVSSDWRNYQSLARSLSPQALAAALSEYYAVCEKLLQEAAPKGNYFCDWIADELFVTIFALTPDDEAKLADQAMTFARQLLAAKKDFLARHAVPRSIDVGVAGGEALLGMMGPLGLCKATALGPVPTRARRLQAAGKTLRRALGDEDRVVFGTEVRDALSGSVRAEAVETGTREELRDLVDGVIYAAS